MLSFSKVDIGAGDRNYAVLVEWQHGTKRTKSGAENPQYAKVRVDGVNGVLSWENIVAALKGAPAAARFVPTWPRLAVADGIFARPQAAYSGAELLAYFNAKLNIRAAQNAAGERDAAGLDNPGAPKEKAPRAPRKPRVKAGNSSADAVPLTVPEVNGAPVA